MRKIAILSCLVCLVCLATTAQAQWRVDNIGMFLDPADANSWCYPQAGGGSFHVYILGTRMTAASCKGVEFELAFFGPGQVANWTHPEGIDFGGHRETDHTIGYVVPEPVVNGQFVFAEFDLVIFDPSGPTLGFLGPIYFHSLPNALPAYLDGEDPTLETINQLHNYIGDVFQPDVNLPVLILNGDCEGVPNEDISFGSVKALFR